MRRTSTIGIAFCLLASACVSEPTFTGVDVTSGRAIHITRERTRGHSFDGVYRSAQLGDLRLLQQSGRLYGSYVQSFGDCDVLGSLEGSVNDNLAQFRWAERDTCPNRTAVVRGRGFVFFVEADSSDSLPRLFGRRMHRVMLDRGLPGRGWSVERDLGVISAVKR